jgi:iron complex outermembrane receptor protein
MAALVVASFALGTLSAGAVFASETRFDARLDMEIAAGPLQDALERLAELTGLQILYDPPLVQGRLTQGVKGKMTPGEALGKLLTRTDILFEFTASDAAALYRKPAVTAQQRPRAVSPSTRPPTVTVSADRTADGSYNVNTTVTSLKVDADALVTPIASEAMTQQVLRDQQAVRVEDVLEYVSGIETAPNGQSAVGFSIRGFPTYQYYVDGVRVAPDLNHDGFRELANVESIEVVKGPLSTLYGRTEPGGLINVVTKQPLAQSYLSLDQQIGSFNRHRTQLDAGGPLFAGDEFLYRFNAAYEAGDSFRGSLVNRRIFLAPVVTWKLSERTETTFYLEYLNSHDPVDSGLPVIGGHLPPVPVDRTVEDGGEVHTTDLRVGLRGSHVFDDGWTERHYVDARWLRTPQSPGLALADDGLSSADCSPSRCPVERQLLAIPVATGSTYYGALNLTRDWEFWRTRHSFLVGMDYMRSVENEEFELESDPAGDIDLFHPQHAALPPGLLQGPRSYASKIEQWGGIYFQDQVALGDRLRLLGGARFDLAKAAALLENALTGRAGFVWLLTPSVSAYLNFTEGFGVNSGLYTFGNTGSATAGASSREWETGFKAEFLDGRGGGSVAWFDLIKHDQSSPVQLPVVTTFPLVVAAARNKGLELDLHGEVLPGLQLLASGAYINSRIIGASNNGYAVVGTNYVPAGLEVVGAAGNRLFGVPRFGGSLWMTYHVTGGSLGGLKLGLGAVARGEREGDDANDYQLRGFVRWNALAAYGWQVAGTRLSVQINVDNLFNARYFESVSGTYTVMPSSPRSWIGSVRVEF